MTIVSRSSDCVVIDIYIFNIDIKNAKCRNYVFILWVVSSASQDLTPAEMRRVDVVPLYHTRTAACPCSRVSSSRVLHVLMKILVPTHR